MEIAIVNGAGRTVYHNLVNPLCSIGDAKKIHGITDEMVANAPTLKKQWPTLEHIIRGADLVIYNKGFDITFFPQRLSMAATISCAMERFAPIYGDWNSFHGSYTWKSLKVAMDYLGLEFEGAPHRALADSLACRAVWLAMEERDIFGSPPHETLGNEVPF